MNLVWHNVGTFAGLQAWLDERDLSIGDLSRPGPGGFPWEATLEPNNPDNPLVEKLGRKRADFLADYRLCRVTETGADLKSALLAALRKVDELLGHVPVQEVV